VEAGKKERICCKHDAGVPDKISVVIAA